MTRKTNELKRVTVFIILTFFATWTLEFKLYSAGGLKAPIAIPVMISVMFIPMLMAIITIKLVTHESLREFGLTRGSLKYYLFAFIFPIAFLVLGLFFVIIFGTANFQPENLVNVLPKTPAIPWYLIGFNLLLAPFINFIPSLGEEYGWRGFLLPELIKNYGVTVALVFTGIIWGIWHAPVILMGYNYPNHSDLLGVVAFTIWCTLLGFYVGWLRIKSGSVFPSALCHGAINAYVGFGLFLAPVFDEISGVPFGWPALLALLIFAVLVYLDLYRTFGRKS